MSRIHIRGPHQEGALKPLCGAGAQWMSSVITTVRESSGRVTCKSCIRVRDAKRRRIVRRNSDSIRY